MKQTKLLMGMPITLEIVDSVTKAVFDEIFSYFKYIDQKFSTCKKNSEISKLNDGRLKLKDSSQEVQEIFLLAKETKKETGGYFDIYHGGKYDPSGIVKGWAVFNAARVLRQKGFKNFYIDAGGDIQVSGKNEEGRNWRVGIKNPFKQDEIVRAAILKNQGIATSGNYIRGDHIYNPINNQSIPDIVSLTVIGPNVYEADRFVTASFAMGKNGINFIEDLKGFEGYMIDKEGIATMTSGFEGYCS